MIMDTISLKLPKSLLERLKEEARGRGTSRSKIVRDCLEERLLKPKRGRKLSCYDLARDLAGSMRGPRDVATNRKYMEDFGK